MIGRCLGHLRVEAKIGAGGMDEVWRARDTRPDREPSQDWAPKARIDVVLSWDREPRAAISGQAPATAGAPL